MRHLIVAVSFLFAGCMGNLPGNPTHMTPEQLREWVKDKNANVGCLVANTPYGKGNTVLMVLDKGIVVDGTIVIEDNCKVTITNQRQKP